MADRMMNADATAAFLARRPPADPEPKAHVLTEDEAAKLRSRKRGSGRSHSPDGKPARDAGRVVTMRDLEYVIERQAVYVKAAVDSANGPLLKRIEALESEKSPDDLALSHYDLAGKLIAEFWRRGNQVSLRVGGKRTSQAAAGTPAAEKLLAEFDRLAP